MLYINKIDEKNIEFIDNGNSILTSAVFYAESNQNRVYIKHKSTGNTVYQDDYKNMKVQDVSYTNAKDVVRYLNLFIGQSFKSGGTTPIPTPIWFHGITDAKGVLSFNYYLKTT